MFSISDVIHNVPITTNCIEINLRCCLSVFNLTNFWLATPNFVVLDNMNVNRDRIRVGGATAMLLCDRDRPPTPRASRWTGATG